MAGVLFGWRARRVVDVRNLLIIDLECTCHRRGTEPKGFVSEIIEVGAVWLDVVTRTATWEFDRIVKPRKHSQLSAFCTELTTLTQPQVDAGVDLAQALDELTAALETQSFLFASWGYYDRHQLEANCKLYGVPYPFGDQHESLKHAFAAYFRQRPIGMAAALRKLGLPLLGTHHRGLDDARNIAAIAAHMLAMGWSPPPQ